MKKQSSMVAITKCVYDKQNSTVRIIIKSKLTCTHDEVTKREFECLESLSKGFTMKLTAKQLDISPRTVESHIRNLKEKLGMHTKNQLLEFWYSCLLTELKMAGY